MVFLITLFPDWMQMGFSGIRIIYQYITEHHHAKTVKVNELRREWPTISG